MKDIEISLEIEGSTARTIVYIYCTIFRTKCCSASEQNFLKR